MQTLHVRSQELANRQIIQLFYILGGAGFFPSTVSTSDYSDQTDLFHQQYQCFVAKQKCEIPSILARSKAPRSVALTNRWQATTSNPVNNKPSHCISLFKKKQTCFPPKKNILKPGCQVLRHLASLEFGISVFLEMGNVHWVKIAIDLVRFHSSNLMAVKVYQHQP